MSKNQYTVRIVNINDLVWLPAIEQAAATLFLTTHYAELTNFDLASDAVNLDCDYVWVVVDHLDKPVGFAIVHALELAVIHLHELDIHPKHARQGLGRRLIETIAAWGRERGAIALTLTTFNDIPWNGPYYERLGFRCLDEAELSSALQSIRQAEVDAGLPMEQRVCMQLDL